MIDIRTMLDKAKNFEDKGENWDAKNVYEKALLELGKSSGYKKERILCKDKIAELGIKIEKDFSTVSTSIDLSEKIQKSLDNTINIFTKKERDISEIFDLFGKVGIHNFTPKFESIKNSAVETQPMLLAFVNYSTLDGNGNLVQGGDHNENGWFYSQYHINQELILKTTLTPIFKKLLDDNKLTKESLLEYFNDKGILNSILEKGVERFFLKDYISAIHILTPQFERIFLDISKNLNKNISTISSGNQKGNGDAVHTKSVTLGSRFFEDVEVVNVWGYDFCKQLDFTFFQPLGYKLRHSLAHGEISEEECSFENVVLIIFFYLVVVGKD